MPARLRLPDRRRPLFAAAIALAAASVGCGSPQARYRALSFFFDGVPDPAAPSKLKRGPTTLLAAAAATASPGGGSIHFPFANRLCERCHGAGAGGVVGRGFTNVGALNLASAASPWNRCRDCHAPGFPGMSEQAIIASADGWWLHAPVADGDCRRCHEGHRSDFRRLLRGPRIEAVCVTCHEPLRERQGAMAAIDCATCHDPHRARTAADRFLRGGAEHACARCHERDEQQRPWAHAPVVAGRCTACHDPHGGPGSVGNVKRPIVDACSACHGPTLTCPGAAKEPARECDACHDPHGATKASDRFLKDRLAAAGVAGRAFTTLPGAWTKGIGEGEDDKMPRPSAPAGTPSPAVEPARGGSPAPVPASANARAEAPSTVGDGRERRPTGR